MKVHALERFPVIHVAGSKDKVQDFSPVVDDQVELESIEPADGTLPFLGDIFECLMLFLPLYMAATKRGGVDKGDSGTSAHAHHLDKDRQRYANFTLQFYKTIVGHSLREIFPHVLLDVKDIKAFQVLECPAMEQDQDGHHFALRHGEFTFSFLCSRILQRVILDEMIKFFEKFVNYEINFCNFMVGNHSGIISEYFSFQRFKITNFSAIFLVFIYFSYIELTLKYKLVPYGEYTVKPTMSSRWFFEQKKIEVNSSRTTMDIPLRQSGTMRGSITYKIGENSVEATLKHEGLRFVVTGVTDKSFTRTLITNAEGQLLGLLPVGEYSITLDEASLAEYTYCEEPTRTFTIEVGKVNEMEPFVIQVQSRTINVKRFF